MNVISSNENLITPDYVTTDVIVIGAGMSGLTVASELKTSGFDVGVFEKARGTGGRLGSKRLFMGLAETQAHENTGQQPVTELNAGFDLGASEFQVNTTEFKRYLQEFELQGVVKKVSSKAYKQTDDMMAQDKQNQVDHYVGLPRNSMLTRHMSRDLDVTFGKKISRIQRINDKWYLFSETQNEQVISCCEHLVLSAPAEQAYSLLPNGHAAGSWLQNIQSDPAFVSVLILKPNSLSSEQLNFIKQFNSEVIKTISIEHTKPERNHDSYQIIKLTSKTQWSLQHLNHELADVENQLRQVFVNLLSTLNIHKVDIIKQYSHRWLYCEYSNVIKSTKGYLSFSDNLHLVGDYFDVSNGSENNEDDKHKIITGVESSYISAQRLVSHLLESSCLHNLQTKRVKY